MESSSRKNARKSSGVRRVNSLAIRTKSVNEAISDALRGCTAKWIADRVETNLRTVENWKQAKTGPQAKHLVAMLQDDELCALVLEHVGLTDLAHEAKVIAARKKLKKLEGK